jgi:hypothetical protein
VEGFLKEVEWKETPLGAVVVGQRELPEQRKKILQPGQEEEAKKRRAQSDDGNEEMDW